MAKKLHSPSALEAGEGPGRSSLVDDDSDPATMDVVPGAAADQNSSVEDPTYSVSASGSGQAARVPLSIPSVPRVGVPRSLQRWDRYQVKEVLGSGGMGAVYKAHDPQLNRWVALKIVHPGLGQENGTTGEVFVKRFVREARLQASLDHPNICKVYEIGELPHEEEESGYPYIAMQLIGGKPLQTAHLEMSLFEKVRVIQQVAEALHVAHRQGLIHRDIKPSNIMVERTDDGKFIPYVMDFGLARETAGSEHSRSGVIEGTPRFMSPEQARGDTKLLDRRTDVYSLGVTLYELLVGRSPYKATDGMDFLLAVLTAEPKPLRAVEPNIPVDLEAVTLKSIEKEMSARYDSAKAFADDLGRYLDGEPVLARRMGLTQRLYRRARRHKALVTLGAALLASLLGLVTYGIRTRLATLARERQAQQQAVLAQRLGQEISKMEWLLRSARQLPLHDLGREEVIVRKRMAQFQSELSGYGALSRGLGHYALGRGHLALHEYPQALEQLQQAIQQGNQSADVHYALGFVLGKHFEQAMYEARQSGGGDWAKKQLKELEPKYLAPAIDSLKRSRAMQSDAPEYLEALIAYYQRDYELALKKSEVAQMEAPWLYEASKLRGDIHLERALQARDSGKNEEAKREFSAAVSSYNDAAAVGQSDAEVYEGLAEAWVRQIEAAATLGQPTETAYAAAVTASDKITAAEPQSIAGPLKKAFAASLTMSLVAGDLGSMERGRQCLAASEAALKKQPGHPYASDVAANCTTMAAVGARARGENPEPLLRMALSLLEPIITKYPHFLWGINDLGNATCLLGSHLQLHGNPVAKEVFEKSLEHFAAAASLDPTYAIAPQNVLYNLVPLVLEARSEEEVLSVLSQADDWRAKCVAVNHQYPQCFINYVQIYASAASRALLAGQEPQPRLQRALENLTETRKLGGSWLDAEQYAALTHLVEASDRVGRKQDPAPALTTLQADLSRCFALASQDAMCRTLAAQAEWVQADWLATQNKPIAASLAAALAKALLATKSPETYPDAWQTLAATHLRLARAEKRHLKRRDQHVAQGLAEVAKVFAINPNHALGLATQGALQLIRAQAELDPLARRLAAQAAAQALAQALQHDPFLAKSYTPLLHAANELVSPPG